MCYFYRAIASAHPYPHARDNLQKLCGMVKSRSQALISDSTDGSQSAYQSLLARYVSLHASYCLGNIIDVDTLESSVLTQLASTVTKRSFEDHMEKIVLINLAAEFNASWVFRNRQSWEAHDTLSSIMRLNLKTMVMLLRTLMARMVYPRNFSAITSTGNDDVPLTAKAQRLIPSIRQYSVWLVSQASILRGDTMYSDLASELGRLYTKTLNLLALHVPPDGQEAGYLLEEDERTLGFLPLDMPKYECAQRRYYSDAARLIAKARWYDKGVTRLNATEEMQARIHDILADGLFLQRQKVSERTMFARP